MDRKPTPFTEEQIIGILLEQEASPRHRFRASSQLHRRGHRSTDGDVRCQSDSLRRASYKNSRSKILQRIQPPELVPSRAPSTELGLTISENVSW